MSYLNLPARLMPGEFVIRVNREADALVLELYGELDLASRHQLERELNLAAPSEERLVIDLSGLEFIDSSGLHALLAANKSCVEHGCRLSLLRGCRQVQRVFEITGTLDSFAFDD